MPFESVGDLLPLLILLIPVIQWLRQLFRGDRERVEAAPAERPVQPASPAHVPVTPEIPAGRPAPVRPLARERRALQPRSADVVVSLENARRQPATAPPMAVQRATRVNYRAALRSRSTARHAMVLMTILGPCRARQPFQAQEPQ